MQGCKVGAGIKTIKGAEAPKAPIPVINIGEMFICEFGVSAAK